jgi:hypothetical protein
MPRGTEVEIAGVDASEAIVVAGQHRLRDGHVVTLNAVHEEARQ